MKISHILKEFVTPQAVAQDPGLEKEKDVDVIFYGEPGRDWKAEDGWAALEEVLPREYPRGDGDDGHSLKAQYKVLEVAKHGGAVVTNKPLSVAQKLVQTFNTYGIKSRINQGLNEFAPDDGDSGEDDVLRKYARIWYNGDDATQQQVEQILDRMGWEIGQDEGGYDNGGVFVVRAGDENGRSYISWSAEDLTEAKKKAVPSKQRDPGALATRQHIAGQEHKHKDWAQKQKELEDEFYANHPELDDRKGMAEGLNEISADLISRARDAAGRKWAAADDRGDKKASKKYNAQDSRLTDRLNAKKSKEQGVAEGTNNEYQSNVDTNSPKFNQLLYWIRNDYPVPSPRLTKLVMRNGEFLHPEDVKYMVKKGELWGDYGWDQPGYNYHGVAEGELDEKSTSQAQFRTMAAAAHNPEFAKKVGIKPSVAREFHKADKAQDYKSLPKKADEGKSKPAEKEADYGDDYQAMVQRMKRLAGLGPLKTVYDPNRRVYKNMPTAVQPKK